MHLFFFTDKYAKNCNNYFLLSDGAPHTLAENSDYPKIPVQPIGYDDARYLMR